MGFQGNRYKVNESRIVNVTRKTLPTDSENVLDYLMSTISKPQKEQVTTEIALLSQESIDYASQNPSTIEQIVLDAPKIDSHIELAATGLTRVSNEPGLSRKSVPTNRFSPTGEKLYLN